METEISFFVITLQVSAQIDELGDELIQIVLATQELRASGRIKYQGEDVMTFDAQT